MSFEHPFEHQIARSYTYYSIMASTAKSSRTATAIAPPLPLPPCSSGGASSNARAPVEAFSADVLEKFEHMLERDARTIALDANKRAHIRMLLDDK